MSDKTISETTLQGIGASNGIVCGPALIFIKTELEVPYYFIESHQIQSEIQKFKDAIDKTRQQILNVQAEITQKLGASEASIFDAHLLLLEDKSIFNTTVDSLQNQCCNIAYCFRSSVERVIKQLSAIEDIQLKERCLDLKDVARRVLHNLLGHNFSNLAASLTEPCILVANRLDPSDTTAFSGKKIQALILEKGGKTCHTAIMARSFGIPTIVNLPGACQKIKNNDSLLFDGDEGKVFIHPTHHTVAHYEQLKKQRELFQLVLQQPAAGPVQTKDGTQIELWLTCDEPVTANQLAKLRFKGIGLVRTENFFLQRDILLSENEQFEIYKELTQRASPYPVIIRTIDIGGDKIPKQIDYFNRENNPFLGLRAIRFCLENREFFLKQLRAILKASAFGPLQILYPMITSLQELIESNALLDQCKLELEQNNIPFNRKLRIGAMIETPSAALIADLLAPHCDFLSIGINDLTQYTLAVDRTNEQVAHLYEIMHPAILRLLVQIVQTGQQVNKAVHLCGEMASDPIYIAFGISLGLRSFCIHRDKLAEIQYLIQQCSIQDFQELSSRCVHLKNASQVFTLFKNFYLSKLNESI
ncbi:MAG: phosphoenolpyruvate--protein phosphotransferase [Puniceicoccales bacterium]|jgi:phosphotransferase system enzyme I (PtsI)|nr:phosphoenolpyruvate--protein phosphotransferase [Puniceicoccales bacterium]